jgi:hypothetical protein
MGTLSTVGFIVGGVGAGAGLVLLIMQSSGGSPSQPASGGVHVTPVLGLGSVGATGTF